MKPITFILCSSYAEAEQLAAAGNLTSWRYLRSPDALRGFARPVVWRTPCWYYRHGADKRGEASLAMSDTLRACQAEIHRIGCLEHGRRPVSAPESA